MAVPMPDLNNSGVVRATRSEAAPLSTPKVPSVPKVTAPIGGISTGPVPAVKSPLAPVKPSVSNGVVKAPKAANPFSNASYSLAHALRNPSVSQSSNISASPSDLEEDEA